MARASSLFSCCAVLSCLMWPLGRAAADGVADEAEVNFRLGAERYQAGDVRAALAYFLASDRLAPNHNVRFNIARAFQRLGQYPEAYRWCEAALAGETDPGLRQQLEETRSSIAREVAIVDVRTDPPGATLFVDRRDLGSFATTPARVALAPGEHRLIVEREGYVAAESEPLTIGRGEVRQLSFDLRRIVGSLRIDAEAPTEVRADSESGPLLCVAPCSVELPPGPHVLYFRRPGYHTPPQQRAIVAGQSAQLWVQAAPITGSIVVTAQEPGALVEVDGVAMGFTPVVVRNVPVGARRVRVSMRGFEPLERSVVVRAEQQVALRDLVLIPAREVTAASRLTQTIEEAPASVSVVSAQELEAFRYPTIYEALRGQRGVAISYDGAYVGLSLRGLGQPGDYGNRVLVLSDGASLNDNILWQSYVGYDGRVDLGDVDRIELVRGPGSVLYGTGAVTGVINLVPRPLPERAGGEVRIAVQDTRTARARAAGSLPLGKHGGLTLSAAGAHNGGERVEVPFESGSQAVDRVNRFDAATANARLVYRALTVQAFFNTRKQEIPHGVYGAIIGHKRNDLRDTRGMLEARFEPALGRNVHLYARAFANLYWFEAKQAYPGQSGVSLIDERYTGRWFGAEGRVVVQVMPELRLSLGAEVTVSLLASLQGRARESGTVERYLDDNEPYQTYAGYALVEWQAARWLTVSAGARADAWSTFGGTLNPRLALMLRPTARDVIKLMGGRAFRAPSIYELRYTDGGTTQVPSDRGGNELGPELVWSGELEYTHAFDDGWSVLGAAHLQYALDLIQQAFVPGSRVTYYGNSGSSVYTAGGDLELRREFRAGWMFSSSYTYLVARFTDAEVALGDARVPNVPRHGGSLRGVAPLGVAGLRLALRTSLEAPRRIAVDTRAQTDLAVIADVVLSGKVERVGLDYALGLYNLFDWHYALPTDPTFLSATMPQAGRTLLLSLGLTR